MCWCTKHYIGHAIRERYFSPLVESELLCDSNARFSAAECAIPVQLWLQLLLVILHCVRRNPFCFQSMTVVCELNKEPWGKWKRWYLISSLSFFKIYFLLAQWIVPPPTAPIFSFKSNLTYSLDSEEIEITASQEHIAASRLALSGYLLST